MADAKNKAKGNIVKTNLKLDIVTDIEYKLMQLGMHECANDSERQGVIKALEKVSEVKMQLQHMKEAYQAEFQAAK